MSIKLNIIGLVLLVFCLYSQLNLAQNNIAPTLTATGNQAYCPLSEINVVTDFDIVDPDDTEIEAVYIQISSGYQAGFDSLILNGSHPNISTFWSANEGRLTLKGNGTPQASYVNLIVAVKDVVFKSTSTNPIDKFFSFTIGDANYLPKTDHYYEYVSDVGITWADAKAAAETRTYFGLKGYLVTILYPEEAQLAGEQAAGTGWIGGSDAETEGVWKWVTGPEAGTIFWNGLSTGSTPNYANWNTGEPNNLGDEDYAHVTFNVGIKGSWNDLSNTGDINSGDYQPKGYIVEYGGMPGELPLNISASTSIYVPKLANTFPSAICGSGTVELQAQTTIPSTTVLWFDASVGGNQVGSGLTFATPILNSTTTYYALASENGCIDGVRTSVVATVYEVPIIQSSIIFKNCDEDGMPDGITDYNLEEANDIITNNNSSGLIITYHMTSNEADFGINEINLAIYNNSNGNTVYARVENSNGCYDVCEINLQVTTTSFPQDFTQELDNCDDDTVIDGFYEFDLTQASSMFLSQLPPGHLSAHYYKTLDDALLENNEILNQSSYINETAFSQLVYVRVENDDNGDCFGLGQHLLLTVHPRPEFEIEQIDIYCNDNVPFSLYAFNSTGNFTYEWNDGNGQVVSTLPYAEVVSGGAYTVVATSDFSCKSFSMSFTVVESAIADIGLEDITIVELSDNNSITINNDNNNLGIGDYEFALDDINGPYQDQPFFDHVGVGSHIIYVKDKNLCGISELEVFILGFPKFFTPNNDGNNDTWQVEGIGIDFANSSKVNIYDRYGKLIKQINAKDGVWDGTFNGQELVISDYWFFAELVELDGNIRIYKGHFSLVR